MRGWHGAEGSAPGAPRPSLSVVRYPRIIQVRAEKRPAQRRAGQEGRGLPTCPRPAGCWGGEAWIAARTARSLKGAAIAAKKAKAGESSLSATCAPLGAKSGGWTRAIGQSARGTRRGTVAPPAAAAPAVPVCRKGCCLRPLSCRPWPGRCISERPAAMSDGRYFSTTKKGAC